MASDAASELSDPPAITKNPFSIANGSISSASAIHKHTRHVQQRRPIQSQPTQSQQSRSQRPIRTSSGESPPPKIPTGSQTRPAIEVTGQEEDIEDEDETGAYQEPADEELSIMNSDNMGEKRTPSFQSSASQQSTSSTKYLKPKTSGIHSHCREEVRVGGIYYVCNHCRKAYNKTGGTKNMRNHLKERHQWDPAGGSLAVRRQQEGQAIEDAIARSIKIQDQKQQERLRPEQEGIQKAVLEHLYIQWMVTCDIPFIQVQNLEFRSFLEYINPQANLLLPRSADTIKRRCRALFEEGKRRIRQLLLNAISSVHITCDMWTSSNHLALLGIIGHFADEYGKRYAITLGMKEVSGSHSGKNQAEVILRLLDDYEIRNRLGYFMMDNATSNDTLVEIISTVLKEQGIEYDPERHRLRCNGHIINLAVQDFLFKGDVDEFTKEATIDIVNSDTPTATQLSKWRRLGPIGKLHNIVTYIARSPQRVESFKKISGGKMVHRDQATRWNSFYDMVDWALEKIKEPLQIYTTGADALREDILFSDDWRILEEIRDFLRSFHRATLVTEGQQSGLEKVIPTLDFLLEEFEQADAKYSNEDDKDNRVRHYLHTAVNAGWNKMLKYWNMHQKSGVYIAAIVLDPGIKLLYFEDWDKKWKEDAVKALKKLWKEEYRSNTGQAEYVLPPPVEHDDKYDAFWARKKQKFNAPVINKDELEAYLYTEPLVQLPQSVSALEWWKDAEQRRRLPRLSAMAIDILLIPAMSSEPERVFSGAKLTISDQRNSLKADTIEMLECLKSWYKVGLFTQRDLESIINDLESI